MWLALALAGCAARGDRELLESRLREQEDALARAEQDLQATRAELKVAAREVDAMRKERRSPALLAEQAQVLYQVESVRFNNLLTAGRDLDGEPGDDGLSIVLTPLDADSELLKLPGIVELELLDLALPHDQQQVGTWKFSAEETRTHWHRGLVSSGYLFEVPWKRRPQSKDLTLYARFTTPDGRRFNATQQLAIVLPDDSAPPLAGSAHESRRPVRPAAYHEPATARPTARPPVRPQKPAAPVHTSDGYELNAVPQLR